VKFFCSDECSCDRLGMPFVFWISVSCAGDVTEVEVFFFFGLFISKNFSYNLYIGGISPSCCSWWVRLAAWSSLIFFEVPC